jgi:aminoglycoside/choline kinase family phosphotransferase
MTAADVRLDQLTHWLAQELQRPAARIEVASADASFRRYFRAFFADGSTAVLMDAPPDREDIGPYLRVAGLLAGTGVHVPRVDAVDPGRGFVMMEDLGSTPYLALLSRGERVDELYGEALDALCAIQVRGHDAAGELPPYDAAVLQREMALMPEWFCRRHLGLDMTTEDDELLRAAFDVLEREALAQPRVFVHRDFHSRNLMVLPSGGPGVIDFQDALAGPVGYDAVSLLKDCYVSWPRARVESWLRSFRARLVAAGQRVGAGATEREFLRWFDFIGVQRHVKVLGIFARLWWRDGKAGYLDDLPLTLDYVLDAAARHPELAPLRAWLARRAAPALASRAAVSACGRSRTSCRSRCWPSAVAR